MIKFLIFRPIAVIMFFIAAVALGILAYRTLPVSLMPDIPIPEVTVHINYKNSSAREMENSVVKPIRAQLLQVIHLSDIKSVTRDGQAVINLRFDYGTNVDYAFIEVNEKIDRAMNSLPRDLDRPRVIKASATDIPVFHLNLTLKDDFPLQNDDSVEPNVQFIQLSEFAESVIRRRIEQLPDVALVDLSGTVSPQLTIEPDMQKLESMNFPLSQLEGVLSQNNVSAGNMVIKNGHYQYNIRFTSVLRNKEDVENIYLKSAGKIFKLKDIAKVKIESQKRNGMFASNGKPAITMAVIKQANARLADMKDQIREMIMRFEKDYPEIHFEISQDQTQLLDYSISNLIQNLRQGLLLVIIVVFLFTKDLKLPLLISLSLLVSVIISLLFFRMMHLSINIISLSGLILAIGNMMDNSIVVTDNISQYRERNYSVEEACIAGTGEVIVPQLSSMLVNIAVFLPMIFLSGIAGALMYDEAISVTIGLAVSYLVGITFMPVIYRLAYRKVYKTENRVQNLKERIFDFTGKKFNRIADLDKIYTAGLDFTFRRKKLNILLYLMILPIGITALFLIHKEKIPALTQTEVILEIDWNENINVSENKSRIINLLKILKEKTLQSNAFIGHQRFLLNRDQEMDPSQARIYIKSDSPEKIDWIHSEVKKYLSSSYPPAIVGFEPPVSIFEKLFTSNETPLVAEIFMINSEVETDLPQLLKTSEELKKDKLLLSENSFAMQEHIILSVDPEKLLLYNISYDALLKELRTGLRENNIGTLRSLQHFIPIVITGKEMMVSDMIARGSVSNKEKELIPLSALLNISRGQDLKMITSGKDGEYVPLSFYPNDDQPGRFLTSISSTIRKTGIFDVRFSGSIFSNVRVLKEIGILLIISVLLLYFILAAQFESLVQPLLVLLEIPLDIAAAIVVLYLTGQSLNLMSAMGMIIMTGIIITDSILKLDVINQLRKDGYPLMEAIYLGGHRRVRAILMTSLTSILAMIPLLFTNDLGSELQKPFSCALIGGMVVGTLVSLYLLPLVYWYLYRKKATPS